MPPIVRMQNVVKEYHLGDTVVPALRDVSLTVERGEFVSIAGPSGSGKTTLLNLLGCVDTATRGVVEVAGQDTSKLREKQLTRLRLETIGFIFQSFNLVSVLTVFQNIELPLLLLGKHTQGEREKRVDELLDSVGLSTHRVHRPNELSGGQRQRVAIARALATNPALVLADEPTANLDSGTGKAILDLMRGLNRSRGTTFIFSTHDLRVMSVASGVIRIADGRIVSREASSVAITNAIDELKTLASSPQP